MNVRRDPVVAVLTGMQNKLVSIFGLSLVAACGTSAEEPPRQLPSATMTPHLEARESAVACGDDVAFSGSTTPDIRYAYAYDDAGQLVHATGVVAAGGHDDAIDYGYDAAGNFTHMLESNGGWSSEINAAYDAASNLVDYTWRADGEDYHDLWSYSFSGGDGAHPARETIAENGQAGYGYALAYDETGRLVIATGDDGDVTTWVYDDDARTITVDTNGGAYRGVVTYDEGFHEVSEVWGGTDPNAWASSDVFVWNGDQLVSATYSSGTAEAPETLSTVQVDTLRYDCSTARVAHRLGSFRHPHGATALSTPKRLR